MDETRVEMVFPQQTILDEIASGHSQESVALTYAFIVRQEPKTADWATINKAIAGRWPKGLDRVKKKAWRYVGMSAMLKKVRAAHYIDPAEPDPPGWEAGFAENH